MEAKDFRELEMRIFRSSQEMSRQLFVMALGFLDEKLMQERDKKRLKLVHTKPREILTWFGVLRMERRYYVDRETGEGRFLLDEALGLEPRQRLSPVVLEQGIAFSVDMPYRRASERLKEATLEAVHVSPMQLWQAVQQSGQAVKERIEEQRVAMFEEGAIPPGEKQPEAFCVEADGVVVPTRKSGDRSKHIEIKLAVAYDGKEAEGKGRKRLVDRRVHAGVREAPEFFEESVVEFAQTWDLGSVTECTFGCDGAGWVKKGQDYFPGAKFRLDPYHLRRALRQGLGHDPRAHGEVWEAIAEGMPWSRVAERLGAAFKRARGKQRDRVREVEGYLASNWDGIMKDPTARSLGAIEGQVFHHAARRMKRQGARWSASGADHLSRLLAVRANGELRNLPRRGWGRSPGHLDPETTPSFVRDDGAADQLDDVAEWLQARVPALYGPNAGRLWVKHVLRTLVRGQSIA